MGCSWPTIAASQQCHLRLQAVLSRCGPRPQPSLRNLNLQPLLLGFLHQSHYTLKAALQLFFFRWLEGVMGVLLAGGCVFASCLLCAWVLRPKAKRLLLLVVVLPLAVLSVGASVAAVVLAIVAGTSVGTHCTSAHWTNRLAFDSDDHWLGVLPAAARLTWNLESIPVDDRTLWIRMLMWATRDLLLPAVHSGLRPLVEYPGVEFLEAWIPWNYTAWINGGMMLTALGGTVAIYLQLRSVVSLAYGDSFQFGIFTAVVFVGALALILVLISVLVLALELYALGALEFWNTDQLHVFARGLEKAILGAYGSRVFLSDIVEECLSVRGGGNVLFDWDVDVEALFYVDSRAFGIFNCRSTFSELWWLPRQTAAQVAPGLLAVMLVVVDLSATLVTFVIMWFTS
ncbi:MAG: hypothetical protein KVP17_002739 [Porospora cf. gigantea B]|uniref:uncharacterized protein n=1 Tax=Porospora cf. gigantea B TaxID=2853592 RepID=UPI0035717C4B|nr:MAG: hypothetical protein KVP17_002739 [Porospora cf. gigantea B]